MTQVIDHFSQSPLSKWRIDHKRLWLEYLQTGKLPFTIEELHNTILNIVNKPENIPRGEKLLHFQKRNNFTLKENKTPYRPEEALERFIVVSNEDNVFNQVPVGGGKESIDLVVRHSRSLLEFIELKPWNSGDSPLYALIESLKNLVEYRVIVERKLCEIDKPWTVDVSVLAPKEYYQNFLLLDDSDSGLQKNISRVAELLDQLGTEFDSNISVHSLGITADRFNQACSLIYDQQDLVGQQVTNVTQDNNIVSLNRSYWTELASSRFSPAA